MGGKGNAAPVMAIADEMLAEEPWKDLFDGPAPRYAFYGPEEERKSLAEAGLVPVRVELIGKDMVFNVVDDLMGWVRTTWHLYLDPLPEEVRPAFVTELASRYAGKYPSPDGRIHVPMVRLEIEAVKE
jgi:trans-aconitate methyltransferase